MEKVWLICLMLGAGNQVSGIQIMVLDHVTQGRVFGSKLDWCMVWDGLVILNMSRQGKKEREVKQKEKEPLSAQVTAELQKESSSLEFQSTQSVH